MSNEWPLKGSTSCAEYCLSYNLERGGVCESVIALTEVNHHVML